MRSSLSTSAPSPSRSSGSGRRRPSKCWWQSGARCTSTGRSHCRRESSDDARRDGDQRGIGPGCARGGADRGNQRTRNGETGENACHQKNSRINNVGSAGAPRPRGLLMRTAAGRASVALEDLHEHLSSSVGPVAYDGDVAGRYFILSPRRPFSDARTRRPT